MLLFLLTYLTKQGNLKRFSGRAGCFESWFQYGLRQPTGGKRMRETHYQRNQKDTIFRMLFREKKNALDLYNALNRTAYTDADKLEITTLENTVYMKFKKSIVNRGKEIKY